jgi:hypothetical protein
VIVGCEMMKQIAILILAACCTSGCMRYIMSEPLPAIVWVDVDAADLPDSVRSAVRQREPNADVVKVVGTQFKKKITFYEVTVRDDGGEKTYDVSSNGTHCQLTNKGETPNKMPRHVP